MKAKKAAPKKAVKKMASGGSVKSKTGSMMSGKKDAKPVVEEGGGFKANMGKSAENRMRGVPESIREKIMARMKSMKKGPMMAKGGKVKAKKK